MCHFWARQRASVWFTSVCFLFPLAGDVPAGDVPDSGCSSRDPRVQPWNQMISMKNSLTHMGI